MYKDIAKAKFNKLSKEYKSRDILVLGIESSCDETSISIVKNGREILSNVVATQIDIHARFGGVVPEVASRNHLLEIDTVLKNALEQAGKTLQDIDAIAVTYGAGLVGALMVGVNYAKALAFSLEIPLIAVNHIKGHISANYLTNKDLQPPFVALIVSGGHTALLKIKDYDKFDMLGSTTDDALGECYDKVAKCLGLGYPGGVKIDKRAKEGKNSIKFISHEILPGTNDFSFSGVKTQIINYVHKLNQNGQEIPVNDICASFQTQVIDEVVKKSINVALKDKSKTLVVGGGVSANSYLREKLQDEANLRHIKVYFPSNSLSGDNGAMIASEGYFQLISGKGLAGLDLTPAPNINLKWERRREKNI
ncbi:MAG TPA: tRNA (adenosine(37)-N6)-threonylcarbamoyltransferase complex transferase subunit TsaD [Clostridiales bacterium]|nr:tRNA (adenosine(37)-N6)-threonylcarbamoyltransferase complex transferase subunit TsaD [Clostridiales bacterium]